MIQQAAVASWQPMRVPMVGASLRWGALAFVSLAVPVVMAAAALSQTVVPASMAVPAIEVVMPAAVEVPVAPLSEPAVPIDSAPAPVSDTAAPALPSYFGFSWAAECETECPGRVA